ncbi:MAG: acyl-CoA hydrolase [Flavobacteriaceae bacterium]|jgi:acyl-CoA hydrolase
MSHIALSFLKLNSLLKVSVSRDMKNNHCIFTLKITTALIRLLEFNLVLIVILLKISAMKAKKASETLSITTKVVLPNDTNTLGNLFGGELLAWMDVISSVAAHRHCKRVVVTAAVNNVSFKRAIKHASIVTLEAKVTRAFKSSMEIIVDVFDEDPVTGERVKANEGIYTFVAVDQNGGPIEVPELIPESEQEIKRYEGALRRKQLSLILAGKMKPEEATELKKLFQND